MLANKHWHMGAEDGIGFKKHIEFTLCYRSPNVRRGEEGVTEAAAAVRPGLLVPNRALDGKVGPTDNGDVPGGRYGDKSTLDIHTETQKQASI